MVATRVIMVELMTRNKALPGDSPDYYIYILIYFLFNKKEEHVLGYSFPLGIFGR